jgi:DNA-directed RNA polymerase specialized sigma24 family protein
MTYREIAKALGIPKATVQVIERRALKKLARYAKAVRERRPDYLRK